MAYENQTKCPRCGIAVPDPGEDAPHEASYCDTCYDELTPSYEDKVWQFVKDMSTYLEDKAEGIIVTEDITTVCCQLIEMVLTEWECLKESDQLLLYSIAEEAKANSFQDYYFGGDR